MTCALWYGVIFMVNMQMAFLSPPFGYSLFYLKSVAPPQITMATIFKAAVNFMVLQWIGVGSVHLVSADRAVAAEPPLRRALTSLRRHRCQAAGWTGPAMISSVRLSRESTCPQTCRADGHEAAAEIARGCCRPRS